MPRPCRVSRRRGRQTIDREKKRGQTPRERQLAILDCALYVPNQRHAVKIFFTYLAIWCSRSLGDEPFALVRNLQLNQEATQMLTFRFRGRGRTVIGVQCPNSSIAAGANNRGVEFRLRAQPHSAGGRTARYPHLRNRSGAATISRLRPSSLIHGHIRRGSRRRDRIAAARDEKHYTDSADRDLQGALQPLFPRAARDERYDRPLLGFRVRETSALGAQTTCSEWP